MFFLFSDDFYFLSIKLNEVNITVVNHIQIMNKFAVIKTRKNII